MISLRLRILHFSVERGLAKAMLLLGLCAALTQIALAQAPTAEQQLEQELKGKVLLLRGFPDDGKIEYSSDGNVISKIRTGSWTTSNIRIDRIEAKDDHVVITGERIYLYYLKNGSHYKDTASKIELVIPVPFATLSIEERENLLDRIFIRHDEDLIKEVPAYWMRYLSGKIKKGHLFLKDWQNGPASTVGPRSIEPPTPIVTTDPRYSEMAKAIKLQGSSVFEVAVNSDGIVSDLAIIRPVGAGLDEAAAAKLRKWKFQPARTGHPFPVVINVEITFDLF